MDHDTWQTPGHCSGHPSDLGIITGAQSSPVSWQDVECISVALPHVQGEDDSEDTDALTRIAQLTLKTTTLIMHAKMRCVPS